MNTLIDGQPSDHVPADDRGLLFGEQLFETMAFIDGAAPLWARHMDRLQTGAERLGLTMPEIPLLLQECRQLAGERGRSVLRLTLTAGSGGRGYWPAAEPQARRIIQARSWPADMTALRQHGLRTMLSTYRLPQGDPAVGLKHGNRLVQVLAARDCARAGLDEALLCDQSGQLAEGIASNLILVVDGLALSPGDPAVDGVGLGWLRDRLDGDLDSGSVAASAWRRCSELMMVNSVAGVRPVVAIDGEPLPVGPLCRHLQRLWDQELF